MMYISTDYVFDGQGTRPWSRMTRHPLNVYGQSNVRESLQLEGAGREILYRPHRLEYSA